MKKLILIALAIFCYEFALAQKTTDPFAIKKRDPNVQVTPSFTPTVIDGRTNNKSRTTGNQPSFAYSTVGPLRKVNQGKPASQSVFFKAESEIVLSPNPNARINLQAACANYLKQVSNQLDIKNVEEEFVVRQSSPDKLGELHIRMQQQYKGIKVVGGEIILHTKQSKLALLNGQYKTTPESIDVKPGIAASSASNTALQHIKNLTKFRTLNTSEKNLLQYNDPESELVIFYAEKNNDEPALAWHVTVRPNFIERWEYYVDAHSGEVLESFNHTCSIDGPQVGSAPDLKGQTQQVHTYGANGTHYLIDGSRAMFNNQSVIPDKAEGAIITLDADNTSSSDIKAYYLVSDDNTWNNPTAISAHTNAGLAYEYYLQTFERNSINGQNGSIISLINVAEEDGSGMDNAFWNGQFMAYGNGNAAFTPLAASLDVAGHEMTHGVIENTANLQYQNESGAINESFADVFGVLIEREIDDWQLGEDVVLTDVFLSGALRDMSDPHNGGGSLNDRGYQPAHLSEKYLGSQDNGGVHINSGIPNHAFYLFATANGVGLERAEQVYFKTLSDYLTSSSNFADLRVAVVQAATDLFAASAPEVVDAAKAAFDAVGIVDGNTTPPDQDEPAVEGDEYVLAVDENTGSLDVYTTSGDFIVTLTNTTPRRKPSVTDDGTFAIYVDENNRLIGTTITDTPTETVLSEEPIWANVAISRDGTKLAATTIDEDTSIYVLNLETEEVLRFMLYNPTYSADVITNNVVYSDAFEWDYTGQYLIYDAFNRIPAEEFEDIEYWDVGVINVWNNAQNSAGSGEIRKLFNSLPDGVNIGNPSFAKNSPEVLTFDYADFDNEEYYVIGYNTETNDMGDIFSNLRIGFPGYSRLDDKVIFDAEDNSGNPVVAVINMAADKINPAEDNATILIANAHYGVWFTQGVRPDKPKSSEKELLSLVFQSVNPPAQGTINGQQVAVTVPAGTDVSSLIASFTSSSLSTVLVGDSVQISGVTRNDFTNPVIYTIVAEDGSTQNYTVTVELGQGQGQSDAKELLSFSFGGLNPVVDATITGTNVKLTVPEGTNVTNLVATFTHSVASTVSVGNTAQQSGVTANDFTNPVIYTVTAENGSTKNFTVTVTVGAQLSSEKEMLTFSFQALNPPVTATINGQNITIAVPAGTDVTALVATFTQSELASVSIGGTAQQSGSTANNFTNNVIYTVTAEDGSTQNYTVAVTVEGNLSSAKELTQFAFLDLDTPVKGTITDKNIAVLVPFGTDITALVATFTQSEKATVFVDNVQQVNGQTANDFTNPVIYSIVAEDQSFQNYLVTVEIDQTTGIDEPFWEKSFTLFPNPSNTEVNLKFEAKLNSVPSITISELSGRVVQAHYLAPGENNVSKTISLIELPKGVYILKVDAGYGPVIRKIIKE